MSLPSNEAVGSGHCVLLVNSMSDASVYGCFQSIAHRWHEQVTAESLLIEGGAQLTPGLTRLDPPPGIRRLIDARTDVIETIVLQFDGLKVCYVRSGGSGPALYRRAFFDEVKLELNGDATLTNDQIRELLAMLCAQLEASAVTGSPDFAALTDALPVKVRTVSSERHP